ncbi:uncharacterized protein PFL1_03031 [Pseudozyma flocculosa PF-1]|uniref:Related to VPS53 - subunit of VP51-54 complex, required for protein sorting n=2 Tax=Pseudozyma flocculosa TaxID=84751 RepID=A0A5C3EZT4_9BASI|nr:uncharacterized protein PFL1_03031 [Pseudozyma flocculosa PF-1]EPQ29276.1 hypothetical protein PFL1_03031 [Pseudozyma flocculosa PF-1]SPO37784.1 related to VPS53 - subunit of VP51-54 complex, required for protein sorting [Pseudozyma flocculosa]
MAAASSAQHVELPRDLAIQIHRVLSIPPAPASSAAVATPAPSSTQSTSITDAMTTTTTTATATASTAEPPAWTEPQPLEAQLDDLLLQHQPITARSLSLVHAKLRHEIQSCQHNIDRLTAHLEHETDPARMADVQAAIAALLGQLNLIREKARESENVVKEITRDIRSLDVAKRNVVASMTALKRLQMLVNGVDQLDRLTETKRYREAASALQAVKALLDFFQSYRGVERIAAAWKQVNDLQTQLRASAMHDYEQFFLHDPGRAVRQTGLADAALVLDAVGLDARNALIEWYCALQLREYRRIFRATDEAGQLDNVSRRFAWFRRVLKTHDDEHAPAFIKAWHVDRWLVRKFAEITTEDLQSVLVREQGRLNVATLLEALNATLDFEVAMSRKFGTPFEDVVAPPGVPSKQASGPAASGSQPAPSPTQPKAKGQTLSSVFDPHLIVFVEAQDRTLAEMFQAYRRQGASLSSDGGGRSGGFGADGLFGPSSTGGGDPTAPGGGGDSSGRAGGDAATVLPSSTEMFYFYRQTLEQCARLSNREPFQELYNVYRKWLRIYADDVLRAALVRHDGPAARRSIDVRPNLGDLQKWCLVLNTADYCASTSSQLEDKIKEKIHADFRAGVSLEEERDVFTTLISHAVQTLAREFELCSEPIWNAMLRPQPPNGTPWNQLRQAGSGGGGGGGNGLPSAYVGELASLLEQVGVVVRQDTENKRFVRSWCDKVVAVVTGRFTNVVVRLRPISPVVAEQLTVDLAEIRKRLEALPRYPSDDAWGLPGGGAAASTSTAAASYRRYVSKATGRIETLLRIIMAPTSTASGSARPSTTATEPSSQDNQGVVAPGPPVDLIETYRRLVGDRSYSNFQKVLDLKGLRKVEANELLDRFLQDDRPASSSTPSHADDVGGGSAEAAAAAAVASGDESEWLTRLDMDGSASQSILAAVHFDGTATPPTRGSLHLGRSGSGLFASGGGGDLGRNTPPHGAASGGGQGGLGGQQQDGIAAAAGSRALSDLRRFKSMFGAALGAAGRRDGGGGAGSSGGGGW